MRYCYNDNDSPAKLIQNIDPDNGLPICMNTVKHNS